MRYKHPHSQDSLHVYCEKSIDGLHYCLVQELQHSGTEDHAEGCINSPEHHQGLTYKLTKSFSRCSTTLELHTDSAAEWQKVQSVNNQPAPRQLLFMGH